MTVDTKTLVTTVSFLIGVRKELLTECFDAECHNLLENLFKDENAKIIRYLCKIRSTLFQKFKTVDREITYNLKNLNTLPYFDLSDIKELEKMGISIIKPNQKADKYISEISRLISENIERVRHLFPEWLNWHYIKSLFCIPHFNSTDQMKKEFAKYMGNINSYPFQLYIYWEPQEVGSLLFSDRKFLKILYAQHGEVFDDVSKYKDATEETKNNIYDFVADSGKTVIAVDCENSDIYKLCSCLQGLNSEELNKVEKIVLYDDYHTTEAWEYLSKYVDIPVEYVKVERVTDRKSLVDIKLTAGICKYYYENNVDSFILFSSDSDYWGLISSLPNANFLIMYEYDKCGNSIKNALNENGIYYCAIDDFCQGNIEKFKKLVLFNILEKYLPDIAYINGKELVEKIYTDARITASETEKNMFFTRYIKTIQLKCDSDGNFTFEIKKQ